MKRLLCWLLFWFSLALPASALERFDIVTTEQLKQLLDERAAGKIDFVLVNTLDALIYEHHSIPDSVNIPWDRADGAAAIIGDRKDRMIVTY